jgi:hypothetical protein
MAMNDSASNPVIFLALANDREDRVDNRYLRKGQASRSRGRRPGDGTPSGYTFLCNKEEVLS